MSDRRKLFAWLAAIGLCFALVLLAGCAVPQWRVFQKTVPADTAKPAAQIEGERRSAAYIALRSAPPVVDAPKAVADIHTVATGLAASLGEPEKAVTAADLASVVASLREANRAKEEQLERWKEFGRKYAGTPLENTGINLAGPAGLLGLVAVIAACIACPALGYLVLRLLPLLWGFFTRTTTAIGEFTSTHSGAGDELKDILSVRMDEAHKSLVRWKTGNLKT